MNIVICESGGNANTQALIREQNKWKSAPFKIVAGYSEQKCDDCLIHKIEELNIPIDMILLVDSHAEQPFLNHFKDKIVQLHPTDVKRSVFQALRDGDTKTRSTVHLLNGPILVSGPWVPYHGPFPITQESAIEHRELQKKMSDCPAITEAVQLISQGRLSIDSHGIIYMDGEQMPKSGVTL